MDKPGCLLGWLCDFLSPGPPGRIKRRPDYRRVGSLLTPAEMAFHNTLRRCVMPEQVIYAKVRLADILNVASFRGMSRSQYLTLFNRINRKHVDFVICEINTLRPMLIIELDDRTHQRADRADRDRFLDRACQDAGLPVLHVRNGSYNLQSLTQRVKDAIPVPQTTEQPPPRQDGVAI